MENLGYLALILALCLSLYAIVTSLTGRLRNNLLLEVSAQRAVLAAWVLVTTSSASLLYLILSNDFRISYVVSRSNADMAILYKFAAWWGGQEGSILFWTWISGELFVHRRLYGSQEARRDDLLRRGDHDDDSGVFTWSCSFSSRTPSKS